MLLRSGIATACALFLQAGVVWAEGMQTDCTLSVSAPLGLGVAETEHTLTLFWAGADCNTAVAGRAVFNADGHPVYIFTEDSNRMRLKEPGVPPRADEWRPNLAEMIALETARLRNTSELASFADAQGNGTIYPKVEVATWESARASARPMMCHKTGYSVSACFWLPPGAQAMQMLFESGS